VFHVTFSSINRISHILRGISEGFRRNNCLVTDNNQHNKKNLFVIIVLKVPGHSKYGHSTKFPVRSRVKYAILQIKSPDHNVDEIKMAREDGTWGDVTDADAGVAGLDDSLQLQASFFPFSQSEKKTDSGWQSRENRRVTRVLPKLATCSIQRRNKFKTYIFKPHGKEKATNDELALVVCVLRVRVLQVLQSLFY